MSTAMDAQCAAQDDGAEISPVAAWPLVPLKRVATCNDDVLAEDTPDDYEIQYVDISGVDRLHGIVERETMQFGVAPSRARRRVRDGDVIISTVRTYLRAVAAVESPDDNLIVSTGFAVIRPGPTVTGAFLGYALTEERFVGEVVARSVGVSYPAINASDLMTISIGVPPVAQQHAIVAFLDRQTAKLDALVTEQQRLIALLREKRQAIVSHTVTRGMDLSVRSKPSEVSWLGDIPEHWGVVQSRRLFRVRSEAAWPDDEQLTASQKYGILFQRDFVQIEGRRVVETILGRENLLHVEPDDFVISMRSFQGGLERSTLRGSISFHYVMLTPIKDVHPPFFAHVLKSATYIQALRATSNLIRDGQELRYSNFVQVPLPLVPLDEQREIAEYLDVAVAKVDELTLESERTILLLQERRAALISAAVTGRIDVRAHPPDEEPVAA